MAFLSGTTGSKFLADQIHQRASLDVEFDSANMKRGGSGDIVILVADQEAAAEIDRPVAHRLFKHARHRLSAATLDRQFLDCSVRMMGAIVEGVDMRTSLSQDVLHVRVDSDNRGLVIQSARDTGLIG